MNTFEFLSELDKTLHGNILRYWLEKVVDKSRGGFLGRIDSFSNVFPDAPKGAILNGRLLLTFAAAYRQSGREEYFAAALLVRDYIVNHFIDKDFGGVFWSVDCSGNMLDGKKQFYAVAFVLYGFSELYKLTADSRDLQIAKDLFAAIEEHSLDNLFGGYCEAKARDWSEMTDMRLSEKDANVRKSMNTHLHILEAYTNLLSVWPDAYLKQQTRQLIELFLSRILDAETGHLGLFFDENWQCRSKGLYSYGHDIEASWLLLAGAELLDDPSLYDRTKESCFKLAQAALEAYRPDGSMIYARHPDGSLDEERHWWVQAECLVGLCYLYKKHSYSPALSMMEKSWAYIKEEIIDWEGGEWWWSRMPDGSINKKEDKAGFWKCPYHNSRMCLEIMSLL